MMNNGFGAGSIPEGCLLDSINTEEMERNFAWASMITMMFYLRAGTFAKIETVVDFKKAFNDFNDSIQRMDIPELEAKSDEV